jgi:hypothetical protein
LKFFKINLKKYLFKQDTDTAHLIDVHEEFAKRLKTFVETIKMDQKKAQEKALEMKRNAIFQKYLHSRVSGPVLNDFYSRF